MRLVQRVGRLYRYGQKNKVVVFNISVPQPMDGNILNILYQRIDQGVRMRQEYTSFLVDDNGQIESNSDKFSTWLMHPAEDGEKTPDRKIAKKYFSEILRAMQNRLGKISNSDLHPENYQVVSGRYS